MNKANRDMAEDLGVRVRVQNFDGGHNITLQAWSRPPVRDARFSVYYGDEERFDRIIANWLRALPWPTEDDPRVIEEGVTL